MDPKPTEGTPGPPTGEAVLAWLSTHSMDVVHLTPWQAEMVVRWFEQIRQGAAGAREGIRRLHDQLSSAQRRRGYAEFVALVQRFGGEPEPEPEDGPPTDPMQRALWLRRHRNTGPTQLRRAPRSIPPRGAR